MSKQTRYHVSSGSVHVVEYQDDELLDHIPPAVYRVNYNPFTGFSLVHFKDRFDLPDSLYGNLQTRVDRILRRYEERNEVSALLTGQKGSGKTLLANVLGNSMIDRNVPVILVDTVDEPAPLKNFLNRLGNCMFIFDEYRKVFGNEKQEKMLDFFSGSNYNKRCTLVIENREYDVDEFMLNRPGRLLFHYRYGKLELETVTEVCEARKVPKHITEMILAYSANVHELGMDNLNKIINECLFDVQDIKTDQDFTNLLRDLNIPQASQVEHKIVSVKIEGKDFNPEGFVMRRGWNDQRADLHLPQDENHPVHKALKDMDLGWYNDQVEDSYIEVDECRVKFKNSAITVYVDDSTDTEFVCQEVSNNLDRSYKNYF